MEIRKYIDGIRKIAPYFGRSFKETAKETAVGLTLAGALWAGIGALSSIEIPEQQYNVWQIEKRGNAVMAVNKKSLVGRIELRDFDADGTVDERYVGGFPRPGCYKISKPTDSDQELFERVTAEQ